MRVGKAGMFGSSGGKSFHRATLSESAFLASGILVWEIRIEASVWRGSGALGAVRRASVMSFSQWDSASASHLAS